MFERKKSTIIINLGEEYLDNPIQNQFSYQGGTIPFFVLLEENSLRILFLIY